MAASRDDILRELARRIEQIQSRRQFSLAGSMATQGIAGNDQGIAALDALLPLLPQGRRAPGVLMEFLSAAHGSGAWTLGVLMAAHVCHERKVLVIIDADRQLYLPGAIRLGLALDRCIVLRPDSRHDAYHAVVQSLRSSAVGAVLGWQERLTMRQSRRLQLAAETGGAAAILLRPMGALRWPSCAAVRLLVSPMAAYATRPFHAEDRLSCHGAHRRFGAEPASMPDRAFVRHVQVEVKRCRGRAAGQSLVLEIDDETGHVHAPASLACAAVTARSARASG